MKVMLNILNRIVAGKGEMEDIEHLQLLGKHIKESSHCGLGKTAPNPTLSTIRYFKEEYEAHIQAKRCPALVWRPHPFPVCSGDKMCGLLSACSTEAT
jgi:hypothetical protein